MLKNLFLVLLSCAVGLGLAEAVAWQFQPPPRPAIPQNMLEVSGGVWRMTPNFSGVMDNRVDFRDAAVSSDTQGNRIVPAAPAEAPRRLLVIGDSQTFGHGLSNEESWPNWLQNDLNRRNAGVRVVNMGVPGINIDQYLERIKAIAEDIRPTDVVLIGVSWNDLITPPSQVQVNAVVEGYLVNAASTGNIEDARAKIRIFEFTGLVVPPLQNVKDFLDSLSQTSALVGLMYPRARAIYYRLRDHSPVANLVAEGVPEANVVLLRKIADKVAERGGRTVVALLPERMFFDDAAYAVYSVNGRDFPTPDYQAHLAQPMCQRLELTCLNLFPVLHEHHREGVVFKVDGHYNPRGAAVIGPWLAGEVFPQ